MSTTRHIAHRAHRMHINYPTSLSQRVYRLLVFPLLALVAVFVVMQFFGVSHIESTEQLDLGYIFAALGATLLRLCFAYALALLAALPLALLVTHNKVAERVLLPLFDIMQSLPVLAFFPIIVVFFVHYGLYNLAAIFVLFITMLWSIVFSLVGGLHAIPEDIKDAGHIFGLSGFSYIQKILLPASVPYLVTGSLLAFASGWNIVIVAEVLHTYLPGTNGSSDLFGIGSVLVNSSALGNQQTFFVAIAVMIAAISLLNLVVWQRLLRFAERFKFE